MRFKLSNIALLSIIVLFCCFSCSSKSDKDNKTPTKIKSGTVSKSVTDKQLNITILLDLSDRIEPTKYPSKPEHYQRDIEIVDYFTQLFKKDMESKGAFNAKGKLKVVFSPRPNDPEIDRIASELNVDLSTIKDVKEKKKIYDNISNDFQEDLERIYSKTIETKKYIGSDIWRFFKNDVTDYCIEPSSIYRNILVLITDGYIYHKDSKIIKGNRYSYILPSTIKADGLRKTNWEEIMKSKDYGFITTRNDLKDLDILVLEINPSPAYKNDEDVIKAYLSKWFKEMNVNDFALYNSDLPEYTKKRIEKFLAQ